jgi:WD40 repeat protein
MWRFASDPNAVAFLRDQLKPAARPDPQRLRQLVSDLDSDDFAVRDSATKALEKLDGLASAALTAALKPSIPLEAKRRIEALLDRLDRPAQTPEERLAARAVEALETIGSAEARRLLQEYAKGAPGARLTRLAGEAERRLDRRLAALPTAPPGAKTDGDGDGNPLPVGAIARLGTTRYRFSEARGRGRIFFAPDGRGVASWPVSQTDNPLRVFDLTSGKTAYEVPGQLGRQVPGPQQWHEHSFAFAPNGKTLAYTSFEAKKGSELRVIDWPSGKLRQTHDLGPWSTVAMTFRGQHELILAWNDGSVHVWDLAAQREVKSVKCPVKVQGPWQLSPDGKILAAGEGRYKARLYLWEWQTDKPPRTIVGSDRGFERIEFSPDGSILGTHTDVDVVSVRLWDVATGKLRRRLVTEQEGGHLAGFAFSRDGKTVAATHYHTKSVVLWDVATGAVKRMLPHFGYGGDVAFSPDDRWIAATGQSGIRVWDAATGDLAGGDVGHGGAVDEIAFSPRGDVIATTGNDGTVRVWDPCNGKLMHILRHTEEWIRAIAFAPDGKLLASSGFDNTVRLWDVDTGRQIHRLVGHGELGGQRHLGFTADGRRLVSWGDDYYLRVFDVATGKAIRESRPAPKGLDISDGDDAARRGRREELFMLQATLSPDGGQLLMSWEKGIHFFDVATGKEQRTLTGDGLDLTHLKCAPDQQCVLMRRIDDRSQWEVVRLTTGKALFRFAGSYHAPGWSHDSRTIAAIDRNEITLWEMATGQPRLVVPIGKVEVRSVAFSPDGRYLAAGLVDSTALVWDLAKLAAASPKGSQP